MSGQERFKKKNKSIRVLEKKSNMNDMNASYQLSKYYKHGMYVEKNLEQANKYCNNVLKNFQNQVLRISSVKLLNFRVFESADLSFYNNRTPNLTVLIGDNGAGKSTILDSISLSLSWLTKKITTKNGIGNSLDSFDIKNNGTTDYASVITELSVSDDFKYKIELSKSLEGSNCSRKNSLQDIALLGDIYVLANTKMAQYNLPIMAYYSVERATDVAKRDIDPFEDLATYGTWSKFDGYKNALDGTADFKLFFRWFKYLEEIKNEGRENQKLLFTINKLKNELDNNNKFTDKSKEIKNAINELLNSVSNSNMELADEKEIEEFRLQSDKFINCVINAVKNFMPNFTNLRIQRSPRLDMKIDKDGITLSVLQLSQGEKSMLAMIADISRRLVLLNPSLDDPLNGSGVVLIDEIDLHLHPKWQQSILPNLTKTFPNIQFIVTTHSPQVLTSVHHTCIRILNENSIFSTPITTLGEESRTALEDVMSVDSRPNGPMADQLIKYLEKINRGEVESHDVNKLRAKLNDYYGKSHSQLRLADIAINRWHAIHKSKNI